MNKTEAKKATMEELLGAFYWNAINSTKETNSSRGVTKRTLKEEEVLAAELVSRLGLDAEALDALLNPKA